MKRVLVLTSRFPAPLTGGDKLRIFNICLGLSKEFELVLVSLCSSEMEMSCTYPELSIFKEIHRIHLPRIRSFFQTACALLTREPLQVAYFRSSRFAQKVKELLPTIDGVIAHLVRTGDYVRTVQGIPKVLEMTDAISLTYQRSLQFKSYISMKSFIYAKEYQRLRRYENNILQYFDVVSLISSIDRDYLENMAGSNGRIKVFTNGVDLESLPFIGPYLHGDIIFIGNMRTMPNIDACRFMVAKILPILRRSAEINFTIIGETPSSVAQEFNKYKGVNVVGRVDQIKEAARNASVAVCPIRFGAGVQNKVLEYLALGIPCVTTSIGLEGIAATPGQDLLVADSPEEFAAAILEIWNTPHLARSLSCSGRKFVEREHSWPPVHKAYGDMLRLLVDR